MITITSFFLLLPVTYFVEGMKFPPQALAAAANVDVKVVATGALIAGLCFHSYQLVSVLHEESDCDCETLFFVLFFQTPVCMVNGLGTALALAGAFTWLFSSEGQEGRVDSLAMHLRIRVILVVHEKLQVFAIFFSS